MCWLGHEISFGPGGGECSLQLCRWVCGLGGEIDGGEGV